MRKSIYYILLLSLFCVSSGRSESYTLDKFLKSVTENSKNLKLAAQDLKYAGATKKEAVSGALPSISAKAGYKRNLTSNYLFVDFGDEPSKFKINKDNQYSFNVTLDQTLLSGAVYNAIKAARQYSKLTEYIYDASENEVMTIAKKTFYQALLLKEVFEVSKKSESNALENYENINLAYANGLASEFAKLQAEVRYKEMIPQKTAAERNYKIALLSLKNMAGIGLDEEFVPEGSLNDYPLMPDDMSLENVLINRPDYNALQWEEKLQQTGVKVERAELLPTLKGFFSYDYSAQSDEFKFEDENNSYSVGLNLSIPIFTGGKTRAKIQKAKIGLNRIKINREQAIDNIGTEIINIRLRLVEAYNRIDAARSVFTTAQKAFGIAEATSGAGLTTQLELKDSRVMLDQAEVNYYSAIYEYLDAYFDWDKAVGQVN